MTRIQSTKAALILLTLSLMTTGSFGSRAGMRKREKGHSCHLQSQPINQNETEPGVEEEIKVNFTTKLPNEILWEILSYLHHDRKNDLKTLTIISQVNPKLHEFAVRIAEKKLAFLIGDVKRIKKGSFILGGPWGHRYRDDGERLVTFTQDYGMAVDPVTQEQYEAVMGDSKNRSLFRGVKHPVTSLNRLEETEYISELNQQIKILWVITDLRKKKERLIRFEKPTEEQWEYATTDPLAEPECGNLDGRRVWITAGSMKYSGTHEEANLHEYAIYHRSDDEGTAPVDSVKPNSRGIRGLSGNVWEVTSTPRFLGSDAPSSGVVARGGDWSQDAGSCHSALVSTVWDGYADESIGLRLITRDSFQKLPF